MEAYMFLTENWMAVLASTCLAIAIFGFALARASSNREQAADAVIVPFEEVDETYTLLDEWHEDLRNVDLPIEDFLEKWYPRRDELKALRRADKERRDRQIKQAEQLRRLCENRIQVVAEDQDGYTTEHLCRDGEIAKVWIGHKKIIGHEDLTCRRCGREFNCGDISEEVLKFMKL